MMEDDSLQALGGLSEGELSEENSQDAGVVPPSTASGSTQAAAKAAGKAAAKKAGRDTKPKEKKWTKRNGKWCRGCNAYKDPAEFYAGKALCNKDMKAWRNLLHNAKAEDKAKNKTQSMDFLEEQSKSDKDLRILLETYHRRCGAEPDRNNKRNGFSVSDYMETLKVADQSLRDKVRDYFDLDTWIAFIGKPEHGGVSASQARQEWEDRGRLASLLLL